MNQRIIDELSDAARLIYELGGGDSPKLVALVKELMERQKNPPRALVICANDSVEHVVIGDPIRAESKKEELAKEYFDRRHLKHSSIFASTGDTPYERYRNHMYWHIHDIDLTEES